jgi:hypothetical protein
MRDAIVETYTSWLCKGGSSSALAAITSSNLRTIVISHNSKSFHLESYLRG